MARLKTPDYVFVFIQFILLTLYIILFFSSNAISRPIFTIAGYCTMATGIVFSLLAMRTLRNNLTVFPTPKESGNLIVTGVYSWVRHPIYTGILIVAFGGLCVHFDYRLLATAFALLLLFHIKSEYEEKLLMATFSNYNDYKSTTGKLFPKIKI